MTRYTAVRLPIVFGSPTEGGLAGYFTNGTRYTTRNAKAAMMTLVRAGLARPTRPYAMANAIAKRPPSERP